MLKMKYLIFLLVIYGSTFLSNAYVDMVVPDHKFALDLNLFEDVLDPETCNDQMRYIVSNDTGLLFQFFDAGARTPRGVLTGNTLDLGNYYQCLGINQQIPNSVVEGKYCMINVPLEQDIDWSNLPSLPGLPDIPWPDLPWPELNPSSRRMSDKVAKGLKEYNIVKAEIDTVFGGHGTNSISRIANNSLLSGLSLSLAICLPKVCSTKNAFNTFVNTTEVGFHYEDRFCRLPNDKPWRAGDYVAISIFSLIIFLSILSTIYDLHYNIFLQKDPKKVNKLLQSFSLYTNTSRLITYNPVPGAIECLDGIRTLAMMWVLIGHTFVNQLSSGIMANPLDTMQWIMSLGSIWITAGPITVDTFFMLSGLLLVYTTYGKVKPMKLLKNLHLFYLNRILRILPVLCTMILIQISFLNWAVDGPYWLVNMSHIHNCRVHWWPTILHIQNLYNPGSMCLSHTWYLAIDMQLHIISPIVLVWVLMGRKRFAWTALVGSLVAVLTASTVYNFINDFHSATISPSRPQDSEHYMRHYYVFTLTRAAPFFVGLIVGYLLAIYRGQTAVLSWISATLLWLITATIILLIVYTPYPTMQLDWDNQVADNIINSFMRPGWAVGVGCLVFLCVHGYGGPVNWLLSLRMWKLLSRLSYAMYIVHYTIIFTVNSMPVAPVYFNVPFSMLKFLIDFSLAVFVAFLVTLFVDLPCSVLIKHFLGGGVKKSPTDTQYKTQEKAPITDVKREENSKI